MKKAIGRLLTCVTVRLFAPPANADYVGLAAILESAGQMTAAGPRDVYRVYAEFTNPPDRVNAWYGTPSNPFTIQNVLADGNTLGTGFTNFGGAGGTLAPKVLGTVRDWDTYATIGVRFGDEAPGGDATWLPNPFPVFINGNTVTSSEGIVTLSPIDAVQGRADFRIQGNDTAFRALLMQLVVNVGQHVRGTINIDGQIGAPGSYVPFTALDQTFTSVPSPACLPLFAIACLFRSWRGRMRRAAKQN